MTVILLRHGVSTSNSARTLAGRSPGVDLTERGDVGSGVRIVDDPVDGYSLAMNIPDHDLALLVTPSSECEVFDIYLERGNVRVNNIWAIQGHAILECRAAGLEIVADLQFSGCT